MATLLARSMGVWTLKALMSALYLFAGGTKLGGMQMHVAHFAQWVYPDWFRLCVGAWEVVFGGLLPVPAVSFYGATFLGLGMLGRSTRRCFAAIVPTVLLVLLMVVAALRRSARIPLERRVRT
jgi:hypothetical protein